MKIYFIKYFLKLYLKNFENSLSDPSKYYKACDFYFKKYLKPEIKSLRKYFSSDMRGFGEDAFFVMWFFLFEKYTYKHFLEIGVYRGQTLGLMRQLSNIFNKEMYLHGISPMINANDSVSQYSSLNYLDDIKKNFDYFHLELPILTVGFSNSKEGIGAISSLIWDCIYIDGSHDYEVVKSDITFSQQYLRKGGLLVIDDSSLYLDKLFYGQFKGHPGPSRAADEINKKYFKEILRVGHNRCFLKL
jgi:hypothetical protein